VESKDLRTIVTAKILRFAPLTQDDRYFQLCDFAERPMWKRKIVPPDEQCSPLQILTRCIPDCRGGFHIRPHSMHFVFTETQCGNVECSVFVILSEVKRSRRIFAPSILPRSFDSLRSLRMTGSSNCAYSPKPMWRRKVLPPDEHCSPLQFLTNCILNCRGR